MRIGSSKFLLVWSQIGWFGCVFSPKWGLELVSLVFPVVAWIVLSRSQEVSFRNKLLVVGLALVGIAFDSLLFNLGLIQFTLASSSVLAPLVPLWLLSLWFLFVTSLPSFADLLRHRWGLAFILGAVAGPLTYRAGESFDVLYLKNSEILLVYSVFWGFYFVTSLYFQRKPNEN